MKKEFFPVVACLLFLSGCNTVPTDGETNTASSEANASSQLSIPPQEKLTTDRMPQTVQSVYENCLHSIETLEEYCALYKRMFEGMAERGVILDAGIQRPARSDDQGLWARSFTLEIFADSREVDIILHPLNYSREEKDAVAWPRSAQASLHLHDSETDAQTRISTLLTSEAVSTTVHGYEVWTLPHPMGSNISMTRNGEEVVNQYGKKLMIARKGRFVLSAWQFEESEEDAVKSLFDEFLR